MIFIKDTKIYAKVWKIEKSEKFLDLRISTSEKTEDGTYKNSNWFARAIGHAFNSLENLKEGDKIIINTAKLSNESYTTQDGTKKSGLRFIIIGADIDKHSINSDGEKKNSTKKTTKAEPAEEECPW